MKGLVTALRERRAAAARVARFAHFVTIAGASCPDELKIKLTVEPPVMVDDAAFRTASPRRRSPMSGVLAREDVAGVAHATLWISLDAGARLEGREAIRIDDHLFRDHPLRARLRELILGELQPLVEAFGEVIAVAHHGADALVVLTAVPGGDEAHGGSPVDGGIGAILPHPPAPGDSVPS